MTYKDFLHKPIADIDAIEELVRTRDYDAARSALASMKAEWLELSKVKGYNNVGSIFAEARTRLPKGTTRPDGWRFLDARGDFTFHLYN